MRQLSFSYCFMRDLLLLNVDLCVELFTLGLNDAVCLILSQLIASLLKSKLAQIDHRCLLINIQRVDEFRAADRICTLVISDLNSLRRLCRCLFLQLDSNCAILSNIVVLLSTEANYSMYYGAVGVTDEAGKTIEVVEGSRIPEQWVERRPPRRFLQLNSAPLCVPHEVDSWYVATVC